MNRNSIMKIKLGGLALPILTGILFVPFWLVSVTFGIVLFIIWLVGFIVWFVAVSIEIAASTLKKVSGYIFNELDKTIKPFYAKAQYIAALARGFLIR